MIDISQWSTDQVRRLDTLIEEVETKIATRASMTAKPSDQALSQVKMSHRFVICKYNFLRLHNVSFSDLKND